MKNFQVIGMKNQIEKIESVRNLYMNLKNKKSNAGVLVSTLKKSNCQEIISTFGISTFI